MKTRHCVARPFQQGPLRRTCIARQNINKIESDSKYWTKPSAAPPKRGRTPANQHERVAADKETIRKSLEGDWRQEHLFTLRQSRKLYDSYVKMIEDCDKEIAPRLSQMEAKLDVSQKPCPSFPGRAGSGERNARVTSVSTCVRKPIHSTGWT